jgi:hypothetical protein
VKKFLIVGALLSLILALLTLTGCDREKIVESTEYVHDIEYIEVPPDTIWYIDTVFTGDSVTIYATDTVFRIDTLVQLVEVFDTVQVHDTIATQNYDTVTVVDTVVQVVNGYDTVFVHDTIVTVQHHYDSVYVIDTVVHVNYVHDTVFVGDTVVTVQHHYDTVTVIDTVIQVSYVYDTTVIIDTVMTSQGTPNALLAFTALQYYSDPLVFEAINAEFGINDGWVFYISAYQLEMTKQSDEVYDFYGLIDYWTPDWSAFYPFEFFWRMQYVSGDPADPRNWEMVEPPGYAAGHDSGVNLVQDRAPAQPMHR